MVGLPPSGAGAGGEGGGGLFAAEGAVGAAVDVTGRELAELGLEGGQARGGRLAGEPALEATLPRRRAAGGQAG